MSHKNFSPEQLGNMENLLSTYFQQNNISISTPLDIVKLAKKMGFVVYPRILHDNIDGIIYVDETKKVVDGFDGNKIIAYNISNKPNHVRFVIAHELAHYIKEKSKNPDEQLMFAAREHNNNEKKVEEQEMDYLAAAILIPISSIQKDLDSYRDSNHNLNQYNKYVMNSIVETLAEKYNVSTAVMLRRIEEIEDVRYK
ncbi:MAG: ImmA/IrrE family metallo-endopeptidase [Clostridiales bacterium]|jgi:Zn-dependent peptidase ImmA (M78 family)|nr:ImmA/IrrE family metallo-endopeptidase [Clostridiales bacterium]